MPKTLWDLLKGERCVIERFKPGLAETYCTRLLDLGFLPGASVICTLSPKLGAPKLYRVNNTVYSLDNDVASLVDVRTGM